MKNSTFSAQVANNLLTLLQGYSKGIRFIALLTMLCTIGVGNAWAADFTLTSANSVTVDGVTVTFAKGSGSTAPTWYAAGLRLYAKNTVTITSESEITSIVFDWEKQGNKTFASVSANTGSYSHPSAAGKGTWTGSSKSVIFTLASTSGVQLQLNTLSVTTANGGGEDPTPDPEDPETPGTGGTVTYTVSSATAVTTSGIVPDGSSASLSGTGSLSSGFIQCTNGKNHTLTLKGYAGYKIKSISIHVKSNSSKGTGSFSVVAGSTTIASITESAFNTANWNGSWNNSGVDKVLTMTNDSYEIQSGEDVKLTINCKSGSSNYNSLYIKSYTIVYESTSTGGETPEPETPATELTNDQFAWSAATAEATMGASNTFPTLTNTLSVPVTYESSTPATATIAADGTITLVAPGTTTISATFAGGEVGGTTYAAKTVSYTLTVKPAPLVIAPIEGGIIDILTHGNFGANSNSYADFTGKQAANDGHSTAVYAGKTARNGSATQYNIQLNTIDKGRIATTTTGGLAKRVYVRWATQTTNTANRSLNIYGSNTAFTGSESTNPSTKIGTITFTTGAAEAYADLTGDYQYILITGSGAIYMDEIQVTWVSAAGTVITPTINGENEFVESTEVSITAEDGYKVYYTLDGTEPTNASTEYTAPFSVTATTTVKAIAYDGANPSEVVSKTLKALEILTCEAAAEKCAATESTDKYVIRGYVTSIPYPYSATNTTPTFWMADTKDGGNVMQAYKVTPLEEADKAVIVGDQVEVIGKIKLYNETPEVNGGTYTITVPNPKYNVNITSAHGTVTATPSSAVEGTQITLSVEVESGWVFQSWTVTDASSNPIEVTDNKFTMPASDVTVVANYTESVAPDAVLTLMANGNQHSQETYKVGETVELPATIDNDCVKQFVGWSTNANCATEPEYAPGANFKLTANTHTLYAVYANGTTGETITIKHNLSSTAEAKNLTGNNDAATYFNLDDSEWTIIGNKGGHNNNVGLNKDGTIRLYYHADGVNTLTITAPSKVATVQLSCVNNYNQAWVKVNGNEVTPTDGVYTIDAETFVIGNAYTTSTQLRINSITVTLAGELANFSTTCSGALAAPTFSVAEGTHNTAQSIVISAAEGTIYYTLDGSTPTSASTQYTEAIVLDECGEFTIKAIAIGSESESPVASATYTLALPIPANDAENPYTTEQAVEVHHDGCYVEETLVYVTGIVKTAEYSSQYGNYTITFTDGFQCFRLQETATEKFTEDKIGAGDVIVACGKLDDYQGKCQLAAGCYLVKHTPSVKAEAELAWNPETVTLTVDEAFTPPTLVNPYSVTGISYETSNDAVATVTAEGVIALAGATGKATITATFAGNKDYKQAEVSCTITVNALYTVTLNPNYPAGKTGTFKDKEGNTVNGNLEVLLPSGTASQALTNFYSSIELDNYAFDGFYTQAEGGSKRVNTGDITGNITFYAHWKEKYTITWSVNGNTALIEPTTFAAGDNTWEMPTTDYDCSGKGFVGWTTNPIIAAQDEAPDPLYTNASQFPNATATYHAVFAEGGSGGSGGYKKLTEALDDYSGEYLIVYETDKVAFNGGLTTLDATSNYISVTINDDVIVSNATTDAAKFTFAKVDGGYSILSASGRYIGRTADSNGLDESTSIAYTNTITITEGNADVVGSGNAHLRYNKDAGQTRFRYYKSSSYTSQQALALYKKSGSSASYTDYTTGCHDVTITYYGFKGGYTELCDGSDLNVITQRVNSSHTIPNCGNITDPTDLGRTFLNLWKDQNGKEHKPGDSFIVTQDITLYAQWKLETTGDIELPADKEDLATTDIVVTGGKTLTIPEGKTITINSLTLKGGLLGTNSESGYAMPSVVIPDDATLVRKNTTINFDLVVNNDSWYPFAVPFALDKNDNIDYLDPVLRAASTYNTHFAIKTYDGENRAKVGTDQENNWDKVPQTAGLQPGKGYIISALTYPNKDTATIRIPMNVDNAWLADGEQESITVKEQTTTRNQVAVTAHTGAAATEHQRHAGWNFVANPYLSKFAGSNVANDVTYIKGSINIQDKYTYEDTEITYVTRPAHDFSYYEQFKLSDATLSPAYSFFVQVGGTGGTMTFETAGRQQAPASIAAHNAEERPVKMDVDITLSDNHSSDQTGIIISDRYSEAYEIGRDLEKLFGSAYNLSVYTLMADNTPLAFQALAIRSNMQVIPVGYRAPEQGEYTFRLNEATSSIDLLNEQYEQLVLVDYQTGELTNLLIADYTFYSERTQADNRFAIYAVPRQNAPTDLPNAIGQDKQAQKIIHNGHLYILRDGNVYNGNGQIVK